MKINIAIINNGFLGMVRQWQQFFHDRRYSATPLSSPDFVKIADAHGLTGAARRRRATESVAAIRHARRRGGPVLIDFHVQQEDTVYPMVAPGAALERDDSRAAVGARGDRSRPAVMTEELAAFADGRGPLRAHHRRTGPRGLGAAPSARARRRVHRGGGAGRRHGTGHHHVREHRSHRRSRRRAARPPDRRACRRGVETMMIHDADADLDLIRDRRVAVIGYGSQGHAHALNLRDSGVEVRVGAAPDSRSRATAERDGFAPIDARGRHALGRRHHDPGARISSSRRCSAIRSRRNLRPGQLLLFAHGFAIRFGWIAPPEGVDVAMVAPKAPGHRVREVFLEGAGRPALIAVHADATGTGEATDALVRQGPRLHARGRDRNHVRRGNRDRPVRRAGGALRRRQRAGHGGLRDAGGSRLQAGSGVLRVPARAEADRRPDVSRRPELHALFGERHGRARRLHRGPANRHRRDAAQT